jgi:hypothetical protein
VVVYTGTVAQAIEAVGLMAEDRPRRRPAGGDLRRPAEPGWTAAARARDARLPHARAIERLFAGLPTTATWSRCSTGTRRRWVGSGRSRATGHGRLRSSISDKPERSRALPAYGVDAQAIIAAAETIARRKPIGIYGRS